MQKLRLLVTLLALGAGGFAAASLASDNPPHPGDTGTTATISTGADDSAKVAMCHHTGSRKHPAVTISVSKNSVPSHLRHGDTFGACEAVPPSPPVSTGQSTDGQEPPGDHGHGGDQGQHGNGHGH